MVMGDDSENSQGGAPLLPWGFSVIIEDDGATIVGLEGFRMPNELTMALAFYNALGNLIFGDTETENAQES